jgi:hypothetical protein
VQIVSSDQFINQACILACHIVPQVLRETIGPAAPRDIQHPRGEVLSRTGSGPASSHCHTRPTYPVAAALYRTPRFPRLSTLDVFGVEAGILVERVHWWSSYPNPLTRGGGPFLHFRPEARHRSRGSRFPWFFNTMPGICKTELRTDPPPLRCTPSTVPFGRLAYPL